MKYTNLRAFEKHLEGSSPKHFSDIYMLLMKDGFVRKAATDRLVGQLLADQKSPELGLKVLTGERLTVDTIVEELHSMSLFAGRRVLLIELEEKATKPIMGVLEKYCTNPNRSIFLVIVAPAVNHATNFYKTIEKTGVILEIAEEKPKDKEKSALEWIATTIAAAGKKIEPQACQHLLQQLGTDPALLHNELQKLLCYVGERPNITVQDVSAICVNVPSGNIWQLGEAIFRRDASAALRLTKTLMEDDTAFLPLLRQIRYQFQTEYQVGSIMANGGTGGDVTQLFPHMSGFILDKHLRQVQAYGMSRFKQGLQVLAEAEIMAKNSSIDLNFQAEMLIVKLVTI